MPYVDITSDQHATYGTHLHDEEGFAAPGGTYPGPLKWSDLRPPGVKVLPKGSPRASKVKLNYLISDVSQAGFPNEAADAGPKGRRRAEDSAPPKQHPGAGRSVGGGVAMRGERLAIANDGFRLAEVWEVGS